MSFRLLTVLKLDDWNGYLKGTLGNLLRALRKELVEAAGLLSVTRVVELVYYFSSMMERFLSFYSPESTRFAPKFPRYLFFDVAADGALYTIIATIYRYCLEKGNDTISLAGLTYEEFKELYMRVYDLLSERGVLDIPKIHLNVSEELKKELTQSIATLRGEVIYIPEDSTCSIRLQPKNVFCPSVPSEFLTHKRKVLSSQLASEPVFVNSPAFIADKGDSPVIDLLSIPMNNSFFLRMVEPPEGNKKQGDTLVHVRCTPHDYDFIMRSRDLQTIRSKQIGASAAASLIIDEYPPSAFLRPKVTMEQQTVGVYINDERRGPILVSPQYITDSLFFNEWLDPYDYVNSVQEAKISMTQLGLAADQLGSVERSGSKRTQRLTTTKLNTVAQMGTGASGTSLPLSSSGFQVDQSGSQSTVTLAQNVEALLQKINQIALTPPGPASSMQQVQRQSIGQASLPTGHYQTSSQSYLTMNAGQTKRTLPVSSRGPALAHAQYRGSQLSVHGQPTVLRGFEMIMGNVVVHGNTIVLMPNSSRVESSAQRYSSPDALRESGLLLAGIPVCENPTPLFSDMLKSRMVGRPRREDFNVQTLMLTAKMRRFLEYGDSGSSLLNIYVKYNQNKRSTVTINIQELCASMRGHPVPIIWHRRIDPLFSANISLLYHSMKLTTSYNNHLGETLKLLKNQEGNQTSAYAQSFHNFNFLLDSQPATSTRPRQAIPNLQGTVKPRADDQDSAARIYLNSVMDAIHNTLLFNPHHSPIAQHACLCFDSQHNEPKGNRNSISPEEQAYFSEIPAFDWQSYITTRNIIVAAWRCRPHIYLTLDACKSVIQQDYNYVWSIHSYLEKKRIINDPSIVIMSTVPPLGRAFEDPLQLLIGKESIFRNYNKFVHLYCGECKNYVQTEYYNISVSRHYPHGRFVCESCFKKILAVRGEKMAINYCKLDTSKESERARKDKDSTSILNKWTSIEQFVLLNTVRRVVAENRGFFGVFDYVSKQLNRPPEVCLQAYLAITAKLYEPNESANSAEVLEVYVKQLEQEILNSSEFGGAVEHLKATFNIPTAEALYIAIMARAKILAQVEKSRALSELHSALWQ